MTQHSYGGTGGNKQYALCAVFYVRKTDDSLIVPYTIKIPLSVSNKHNGMDGVDEWYKSLSAVRDEAVYVSQLLVTFTTRG
jgi:hypothetical protein